MRGEAVGDAVPGDMGQRVAVQQQKRRAVAAMAQMNPRAAIDAGRRVDLGAGKTFEHAPTSHRRMVYANLV